MIMTSLENLLALQTLLNDRSNVDRQKQIATLRNLISAPLLEKFDRLAARKKKAVALVQNGVCGGCHLRIAGGILASLTSSTEPHFCEHCGRFLYLPPNVPSQESAVIGPKKAPRQRRTRSISAPAQPYVRAESPEPVSAALDVAA